MLQHHNQAWWCTLVLTTQKISYKVSLRPASVTLLKVKNRHGSYTLTLGCYLSSLRSPDPDCQHITNRLTSLGQKAPWSMLWGRSSFPYWGKHFLFPWLFNYLYIFFLILPKFSLASSQTNPYIFYMYNSFFKTSRFYSHNKVNPSQLKYALQPWVSEDTVECSHVGIYIGYSSDLACINWKRKKIRDLKSVLVFFLWIMKKTYHKKVSYYMTLNII